MRSLSGLDHNFRLGLRPMYLLSYLRIYLNYYHSFTLLCIRHRGVPLLSSFKYFGISVGVTLYSVNLVSYIILCDIS